MSTVVFSKDVVEVSENQKIIFDAGEGLQQTRQFEVGFGTAGNVPGVRVDTTSFVEDTESG